MNENTRVFINGDPVRVDVPNGYATWFHDIHFNTEDEFRTAVKMAETASNDFVFGLINRDESMINQGRREQDEFIAYIENIDPETYHGYVAPDYG